MGRILAIDHGKKRVGLAVTDPLQIIATGLETVANSELMDYLTRYFKVEEVDTIVLGEPKNLDNTDTDSTVMVKHLKARLKKAFPLVKIESMDERFTSKMAFQTMLDSGIGREKRKDKALVDKISATIILQSYMESRNRIHG
jgi:putative holliday junction resolvase